MKKIGKIIINPEKVIKNEELVNLRGGYGGGYNDYPCTCTCFNAEAFAVNPDDPVECYGYVYSNSDCVSDCAAVYGVQASGECGNNLLCS
jgi:hypothetical protein